MPQANQLQSFLARKRAGVLVPLFSVYSKKSFGAADLVDLKTLIDWALKTGNSVIQLLPMNDMPGIFCPYDALSGFALEPLYISLVDLPLPKDKSLKRQIENVRKNLSGNKGWVDYALKKEKLRLCREIFLLNPPDDLRDFQRFKSENTYWLADFSLFKALKQEFQDAAWYDWPDEFKKRDEDALEKFRQEHIEEINFQEWLQWQLFVQFKQAKNYAQRKKVFLNGDLPILVSRDSSDVWQHQEFFKLEFAAGAPPDMYCAKGQRWGMPTYNWERIAADGYRYLKEKLKYAENFYDIIRIDHVVGLFRIWSIPYNEPLENQGLNGFFDPLNEAEWERHGRRILEVMLDSTKMFLCAEDLGVIPEVCPNILRELKIPGNDVQRWVKDWKFQHDFLKTAEYRSLSVTMLSTHDTTNWPAWWENEAGTVDEDLFRRKCAEAGVDFSAVKPWLFDSIRSKHARLRWKEGIDSVDKLIKELSLQGAVPQERLYVLIGLYQDTYGEKEKLWRQLGLSGAMREECDKEIFGAVLKANLQANSLFCINTLVDLLYLDDLWQGDPYQYRTNTPGTISPKNWSLKLPLSLEELMKHPVTKQIRQLVADSNRI
ncbi:MAG: 4-alpha-glucanotransferase [Candidatus Omnitrophica bacterium]|nr:4-alpha-glucanotransferase [Candidatus Omnitrophota bacterium]